MRPTASLARRLVRIGVRFLLVALVSIGLTLWVTGSSKAAPWPLLVPWNEQVYEHFSA